MKLYLLSREMMTDIHSPSAFSEEKPSPRMYWWNLFLLTFLAVCAYVFFEWLFLVTKPSLLSILEFPQKLGILLFSSLLLYALSTFLLLPLALVGLLVSNGKYSRFLIAIGAFLPALILGSLALLLVDNFTYTVFSFGVVTSSGLARGLYAALFLMAVALSCWYVVKKTSEIKWVSPKNRFQKVIRLGLILAFLIPIPFIAVWKVYSHQQSDLSFNAITNKPNILLITSDGVNATSLSLYGYERDTTPYLRELAGSSLVAENAFSNSGTTTGSIVSIYTGKSPVKTRVLHPPDVLSGEAAYQHLPGILRSLGYYNVQIALFHYADALTQNVLEGFDQVNGRDTGKLESVSTLNRFMPIHSANFINELVQRLAERLGHIFYITDMQNPYAQVTAPPKDINLGEDRKIQYALKLLKTSDRPVFIHIHLLGTHGPLWYPSNQVFSAGQDPNLQEPGNVDFYDDSIREFDRAVRRTMKDLARNGLLEKTIVIIGSDHGKRGNNLQRIPLLIRFPHKEHTGVIRVNVQNIDIAPTILDYLGIDKPSWMDGDSILKVDSNQRPIYSVTNKGPFLEQELTGFFETDQEKIEPPFYQLNSISVVYCQKWNQLWLMKHNLAGGEIDGYQDPCLEDQLLTREQAFELLVKNLKDNGFDVSSLGDITTTSMNP